MRYLLSVAVLVLWAGVLNAATINVPADQPTIQAGIDAAVDGDTVLVADGTYTGEGNKNIDFASKNIVLTSENGAAYTAIDCEYSGRAFIIASGHDTTLVIEGFILRNGRATSSSGGAIQCFGSSPMIISCVFFDNAAASGGAIYFNGNADKGSESKGKEEPLTPTVRNCTFVGNRANDGAGIFAQYNEISVSVENSIFYANRWQPVVWFGGEDSFVTLFCCDIFGNVGGDWVLMLADQASINGNISMEPTFCDTALGDYTISSVSPCAPQNNACGVLIGALGIGCFDMVSDLELEGEVLTHVISHSPTVYWVYDDPDMNPQDSFVVEVGTDSDWSIAEMWNTGSQQGQDTALLYVGEPLLDGSTYHLRLRVHNGVRWSSWWYEILFRMNSLPSVPVHLRPINDEYTDNQPWLWVQNSTDAEGDTLTYDFFCWLDTYEEPETVLGSDIPEQSDSTGWQVTEPLKENWPYTWMVRSHDGYESSGWTELFVWTFFVNGTQEPPSAPETVFPPGPEGLPVFIMLPTFSWSESTDPDPLDSVRYKLEIATDSNFTFVQTIDSLPSASHSLADSLTFSTHYWWRVTAFDNTGLSTMSPNTPDFWTWTLGDLDHTHSVDIGDLVMLVDYMFNSGPAPYPLFVADIDGNCTVDISDLVYLVDYMFVGGPEPMVGCE